MSEKTTNKLKKSDKSELGSSQNLEDNLKFPVKLKIICARLRYHNNSIIREKSIRPIKAKKKRKEIYKSCNDNNADILIHLC
jgi:hypothetical protein